MSTKSFLYGALSRRGTRPPLQLLASGYISLRRRQACRVSYRDGSWIHEYRDGKLAYRQISSATPSMVAASVRDYFLHAYTPVSGDTVIDVGAGVGRETLLFSRLVGVSGRVFAFEAHPATANCLRLLSELNGLSNVTPIHCAIGDHEGEVTISDLDSDISNTILTVQGEHLSVPCQTLDSFVLEHDLHRIDYLKMNIEGAEGAAIHSMTETMKRTLNACIACHDFRAEESGIEQMRTKAVVSDFLLGCGFQLRFRESDHRPWVRDYIYASK